MKQSASAVGVVLLAAAAARALRIHRAQPEAKTSQIPDPVIVRLRSVGVSFSVPWWRAGLLPPGSRASEALRNVSLDFAAHSVTAVVGVSGSGKSTLLRVCSGEVQPSVALLWHHGALQDPCSPENCRQGCHHVPRPVDEPRCAPTRRANEHHHVIL